MADEVTGLYLLFYIVLALGRYFLKKVLIVYDRDVSDTPAYRSYRLGTLLFMILIVTAAWILDIRKPHPLLLVLVALAFYYCAYLEKKYVPETDRHKVSQILAWISLFFAGLLLLIRLVKY